MAVSTSASRLPVLGALPATWRVVTLRDVFAEATRNGIYKKKEFHGRGVKIVNMGELFSHRRLGNVAMKRVALTGSELERFSIQPGDLLFARRSLVAEGAGSCTLVVDVREPTVFESSIIRVRPKSDVVDPRFLFYLFKSPYGRYALGTILRHVAVAGITGKDLGSLQVPLPPLLDQRLISDTLEDFDDKIELNRRMSRTLEAISRAIFRSWFVDFDPVRAKTEGRSPPLPDGIVDLFPNQLVDSTLGPIPHGWEVAALGDHLEVIRGLSYRGADLTAGEGLPLHNLNSVLEGGGYKYEGIKFYAGDYKERHLVKPGDVIVANTEQGHQYLLIGCPAIVPRTFGDRGLFSADLFRVRPSDGSHLTERFAYLLLLSGRLRQQITAYTSGTTVNHLSIDGLRRPRFVLPPKELIEALDMFVEPLFALAEHIVEESRTLAETRDWLLPRLMSGRLRVGDLARASE